MKQIALWGLVLVMICVLPVQSQRYVDIEIANIEVANVTEATYEIVVKNVGNTRVTDIILSFTLPEKMQYVGSKYLDPDNEKLPDPTVVRNWDGTAKNTEWYLGDLETNQVKRISLVLRPQAEYGINYSGYVVKLERSTVPDTSSQTELIQTPPIIQVQRINVGKVVKSVDGRLVRFGRDDPEVLNRNIRNGSVVRYEISVDYNDALNPLKNINIVDILPSGFDYIWGSSIVDLRDNPMPFNPTINGNSTEGSILTWDLSGYIPEGITSKDRIYVDMETVVKDNRTANIFANEAYATGSIINDTLYVAIELSSSVNLASLPKN